MPPTALQKAARKIAMDAFIDGQMVVGKQILMNEHAKLSKQEAKRVAHLLAAQRRFDDATEVLLLSSMSTDAAALELAPPPTARVGDILWEQYRGRFYQVVDVKGSRATIREIGNRGYALPIVDDFIGPPMIAIVQKAKDFPYKVKVKKHGIVAVRFQHRR